MIIGRDVFVDDMSVVCLVADGAFRDHDCIACLVQMNYVQVSFTTRDLMTSEREALLKNLTASLGGGFKVEWDAHHALIEVKKV